MKKIDCSKARSICLSSTSKVPLHGNSGNEQGPTILSSHFSLYLECHLCHFLSDIGEFWFDFHRPDLAVFQIIIFADSIETGGDQSRYQRK